MNTPPIKSIRVRQEDMREFVTGIGRAAGLADNRAAQLAGWLVDNDLRGNFSHGTQQIGRYARLMLEGTINSKPEVAVVNETPVSLLVDGDGGLGYFPVYDGTLKLIEKANENNIAVLVTRNHGHFGAAGIYPRLTLDHDLMCFCTSGVQLQLSPGIPIYRAAGGSPIAFSCPAGEEDPLVLDFGTMHDLYERDPHRDQLAKIAPGLVFRSIGLGAVCQTFGGLLAGIPVDEERAGRKWEKATQGACMFVFKISLFMDPEEFKQEMDEYIRATRKLAPLEGFDESYLAGGIDAAREREYAEDGIPIGEKHKINLEKIGKELGVNPPWVA